MGGKVQKLPQVSLKQPVWQFFLLVIEHVPV